MTEALLVAPEFTTQPTKGFHHADVTSRVFEIDPLQDPRWEAFIDKRPDASVFHRGEWLRALKLCYGYKPSVLSSSTPGQPLTNGLVFCRVRTGLSGRRIVSIPFSDHCEPLVDSPEELDHLLHGLTERADQARLKYVEIRPIGSAPHWPGSFAISRRYFLHRLDLQRSEEVLFRSFHKSCVQRKIRRSEREALRYEEGLSDLLLHQFYKLLIMTRRRQGLPPQPLKWFRSLIPCLGPNLKIRVALKGDTPLASILTIADRNRMFYKYGCSDSRYNNLGGTALLFWRTIQEAKAGGMEEFDLGRSDITNVGLVAFKEHWGARRIALNYWRYPAHAVAAGPEQAIKYVRKFISVVPDRALVMMGNLLYPHIG